MRGARCEVAMVYGQRMHLGLQIAVAPCKLFLDAAGVQSSSSAPLSLSVSSSGSAFFSALKCPDLEL